MAVREQAGYKAADRRPLAVPKAKAPSMLQHTGVLQGINYKLPHFICHIYARLSQKTKNVFIGSPLRFTFDHNIRMTDQLSRNTVGIRGDMEY